MSEKSTSGIFMEIADAVEENIEARLKLLQIEASDKTARLIGAMTYGIIAGVLFVFVFLFLSIVGGFYFTSLTGSSTKGFAIIAGIYFIFILLLMMFRKSFIAFISNKIVELIFTNLNEKP